MNEASQPPDRVALLQFFTVSGLGVARAVGHMGTDRFRIRSSPGLRFAKLLGTGSGTTFRPTDADPKLWGILTVWDSTASAERFRDGAVTKSWTRFADETADFTLRPLKWKGEWSRVQPFGTPRGAAVDADTFDGPVASITRARIKPTQLRTFLRAVPPVAADVAAAPGSLFRVGIGEAPVGLQATFSIWSSSGAVDQFAYRQTAHRTVVRQTTTSGWYAEEMFARFAVESATGTVKGATMEGVHRLIQSPAE
jgi:hypothetical protein